jgi:hypothetical protein
VPTPRPSRRLQVSSVPDAFRRAVAFQYNNNLIEAEQLCRDILAVADHFDARHLLGVLCLQQGRAAEAADVLAAALKSKPGVATAW